MYMYKCYQCTSFRSWSAFSCNDTVGVVGEDKEVCLFPLGGAGLIEAVLVAEESVSFNFKIFEDKLFRVCTKKT